MQIDERFRLLLTATPHQLDAIDAVLTEQREQKRPSLRLLRMGEAAALTNLSRTTVWRAVRDGRLKAVEIRKGSLRIAEAELRKFVRGDA